MLRFTIEDLMVLLTNNAGLPVSDHTTDRAAGFEDVGLDSLAFLAMQTALLDEYEVEMPDDIPGHYTFGDIVDTVNASLAAREVAEAS